MIVRPTPSPLLNSERTPSKSPPTRRRANSTSATLAPKQAQATNSPLPPQSPLLQRPAAQQPESSNRPLATSPNAGPSSDTLTRSGSGSGKRKLFRLRRPTSSSSETRPARERTFQMLGHHYGLMHGAMSMSVVDPPPSPSAPPRPPRNPARSNLAPRPLSSGGPAHKVPRLHAVADERELNAAGDSAADWEFPLPVSVSCRLPYLGPRLVSRRARSRQKAPGAYDRRFY